MSDIQSDRNLVQTKFNCKILPHPICRPSPSATSVLDWKGISSLSKLLVVSIFVHFPLRTAVTIERRNKIKFRSLLGLKNNANASASELPNSTVNSGQSRLRQCQKKSFSFSYLNKRKNNKGFACWHRTHLP